MSVWNVRLKHLVIGVILVIFASSMIVISRNYTLLMASKISAPEVVTPVDLAYEFTENSSLNLAHVAFSIDVHSDTLMSGSFAQSDHELFSDKQSSPQLALASQIIIASSNL